MGELTGSVAIVTGAGRGIGRAQAKALAREGAFVIVNDFGRELSGEGAVDSSPAASVVQEIADAGGRAIADTTDISDWDGVKGLVETALSSFGQLDIVLNNAGIGRFGTIDSISKEDWEKTIAVNLTGTAALCHWAADHWRREGPKKGRRIINTTSGVGLAPIAGNPMYVAAKAGIAALTVACALELAELGVRANALAPVARTRMSRAAVGAGIDVIPDDYDPFDPEHAAALAAYLASPSCRFTGRVLGVAGNSITLFDNWSVGHGVSSADGKWTLASVRDAVEAIPHQQRGRAQGISEVKDLIAPANAVLDTLKVVEA